MIKQIWFLQLILFVQISVAAAKTVSETKKAVSIKKQYSHDDTYVHMQLLHGISCNSHFGNKIAMLKRLEKQCKSPNPTQSKKVGLSSPLFEFPEDSDANGESWSATSKKLDREKVIYIQQGQSSLAYAAPETLRSSYTDEE